jgi:type IV pilus assembly protein PilW
VRRYVVRTYYIASCNDCTANDGIPTLKRVETINGTRRITALAEGIENLQVEYGVDADADGHPDEFISASQINGVPATRVWNNVVATRFHVLSRNTEPTAGYTDPRTYQLGPVTVVPANAYKHTLMTQTVRLVNVAG